MPVDWGVACADAAGRSLALQLDILYGSSGVTVSLLFDTLRLSQPRVQIAAFCVSAIASGYMLWRWRRINEGHKASVWRLYGYFAAIICFGSCAGAIAWVANNQLLAMYFTRTTSAVKNSDYYTKYAIEKRWSAAFYIMYSLEFISLCAAKLMVLNRLFAFAIPEVDSKLRSRCSRFAVVVLGVVTFGNFVGLCANIAAAAYQLRASDNLLDAAAAFSKSDLSAVNEFSAQSQANGDRSQVANSVQQFAEMAVLLLIVVAFFLSGGLCALRIRLTTRRFNNIAASNLAAMPEGAVHIQRQIFGTTAFIFVTFTLRAIFSTMYAVSAASANSQPECPSCSSECNNTSALVLTWLNFTPEFQLFVMLISSPLASVVALWGMTSDRFLAASRVQGAGAANEISAEVLNPPLLVVKK